MPLGGLFDGTDGTDGPGVAPLTVNLLDMSWSDGEFVLTIDRNDDPIRSRLPAVPISRIVALSSRPDTPTGPSTWIDVTSPTPNQAPSWAPL